MFNRLRQSPAVLVAALAIVAALGGTALAGSSLTAAKKSKHADAKQDKKQFNSLLKSATSAPKLKVLSAVSATSATNATHAGTADNASHATTADSAQPAAFAFVNGATVSNNKTITSANVNHVTDGVYCISGLPFTIKGGQVTTQFEGSNGTTAQFSAGATGNCPNGGQVLLFTGAASPSLSDTGFYILVYG